LIRRGGRPGRGGRRTDSGPVENQFHPRDDGSLEDPVDDVHPGNDPGEDAVFAVQAVVVDGVDGNPGVAGVAAAGGDADGSARVRCPARLVSPERPSPAYSSVRGLASLDEEAGDGAVEREAVIITIGHEGGDPSIPQ